MALLTTYYSLANMQGSFGFASLCSPKEARLAVSQWGEGGQPSPACACATQPPGPRPQLAAAARGRGLAAGGGPRCHGPAALAQYGGALYAGTGSTVTIRDDASLARNTAQVGASGPRSPQARSGSERTRPRNSGREAQSLPRSL